MLQGPGFGRGLFVFFLLVGTCHPGMAAPQHEPIDLTSPPPAEDGIEHGTPPRPHADTLCTICLGSAQATTLEPIFRWPPCGHVFHLTCVANLRAHNPTPTCPACRSPWHTNTETHFQQLCAQHELLLPEPATRAGPPPSPAGVLPLCCHRVLLLDPTRADRDDAWRELPERHMHWAPPWDHTSQQWRPEWTCLRCNTTVTPEHPLLQHVPEPPHCPHHGPRTLVLDFQRGERGWACTRGTDILPCTPTALPTQPPTTTGAAALATIAQHTDGPATSGRPRRQTTFHLRNRPSAGVGHSRGTPTTSNTDPSALGTEPDDRRFRIHSCRPT